MTHTNFNWQGDEDDAVCDYCLYLLRVECMDKDSYWWQVYDTSGGATLGYDIMGNGYTESMSEAKKRAEQIVREL